jgi:rod shape-determining protein MreD
MQGNFIRYFLLFVALILLQVLILDHISFLGYATPFLYIYFILKLPIGMNRYLIVFLGFITGLTIDLFCNTPGMNAAATTFIAFFRRSIQGLFFQREDFDSYVPAMSFLGSAFVKYVVLSVILHHTILLSIESFSYFNWLNLLIKIISSSILTSLLIIAFDGLFYRKVKRE